MKISFACNPIKQTFSFQNTSPIKTHMSKQICFGDTFEKSDTTQKELNAIEELLELRNNAFQQLREKMQNAHFQNVDDEIQQRSDFISELNAIKSQYETIDELLSKAKDSDKISHAEIIKNYIIARENIAKDTGFNKISGYTDIVNKMKEVFSMNIILNDKLYGNKDKKVPNILLFYGPTGTGKTTFAKALAEDSLSNIIDLSLGEYNDNRQRLEMLENALKKADNSYNKDKKRTIILINEADSLIRRANPESTDYEIQKETLETFLDLVKDCADKYKTTIFLTTNHPLRMDEKILSDKITPIKVGLGPCTKKDAKLILEKNLKYHEINIDTKNIIERLFQNPERMYSNSNIVKLVEKVCNNNVAKELTEQDFLLFLDEKGVIPSIKPRDLNDFKLAKEKLNPKENKDN